MDEIRRLKREGLSISEVARLTGRNRRTVRKYLDPSLSRPVYGQRPPRESKLSPYFDYLHRWVKAGVWNAVVLLEELRAQGYDGSYTILKEWWEPQREQARVVAVRRFETAAGEQAQVDWGSVGVMELGDGSVVPLPPFVMTLGYKPGDVRAAVAR